MPSDQTSVVVARRKYGPSPSARMPPRKPTAASAKSPPDATPNSVGLALRALQSVPGFAATMITPAVAIAIAATRALVSASPRNTNPNTATCTASVFVNAVATENARARIAASSSAVAKICARAPADV